MKLIETSRLLLTPTIELQRQGVGELPKRICLIGDSTHALRDPTANRGKCHAELVLLRRVHRVEAVVFPITLETGKYFVRPGLDTLEQSTWEVGVGRMDSTSLTSDPRTHVSEREDFYYTTQQNVRKMK